MNVVCGTSMSIRWRKMKENGKKEREGEELREEKIRKRVHAE
jgi:hypothetical protein